MVDAAFLGGAAQSRTSVQVLQAAFFLAVAGVAVTAAGLRVRPGAGARVGVAASTALAVALAVVLAGTGGPKRVYAVDAAGPVACDERQVVCLWADRAHLTGAFAGLGTAMLARVPTGVCASGWAETGLRRAPCVAEVHVGTNTPATDAIAQALAEGLADLLAPDLPPGAEQRRLLVGWLASRALGGPVRIGDELQPRLAELLAAPPDAQWAAVLALVEHA